MSFEIYIINFVADKPYEYKIYFKNWLIKTLQYEPTKGLRKS